SSNVVVTQTTSPQYVSNEKIPACICVELCGGDMLFTSGVFGPRTTISLTVCEDSLLFTTQCCKVFCLDIADWMFRCLHSPAVGVDLPPNPLLNYIKIQSQGRPRDVGRGRRSKWRRGAGGARNKIHKRA
ncbi:hypothetical protein AMECASPLE_019183, partial [Ameca splendens]